MAGEDLMLCRLTAQNVLRLKCVDIEFDGAGAVVIGGRNAQGKSSALNAIWYALGGKRLQAKRPIRDGEDHAMVRLDLGEYVVTREWTEGQESSPLRVTAKDGATYRRPQELLDGLIGARGFDVMDFMRQRPEQQHAILREMLGLDFTQLERDRQTAYDQRRDINRDLEQRRGALKQMPEDREAPSEEVSISAVAAQLREAEQTNRSNESFRTEAGRVRERLQVAERQMNDAWAAYQKAEQTYNAELEHLQSVLTAVEGLQDVDTQQYEQALAQAEEVNARVRAQARRRELELECAGLAEASERLTERLREIDEQKQVAIAQAELPIEGLGFGEGEVLYHGMPLTQASAAEQLRVSLAIGLRLNPRLKIMTIYDGSLLDAENLQMVRDMAREAGAQVLIERVGAGPEVQVVIEDGQVQEVRG